MGNAAKLNASLKAKKQAKARAKKSKSKVGASDPLYYETHSGETKATIIYSDKSGNAKSVSYPTIEVDNKPVPVPQETKVKYEKAKQNEQEINKRTEARFNAITEKAKAEGRNLTESEVRAIYGGQKGRIEADKYSEQVRQANLSNNPFEKESNLYGPRISNLPTVDFDVQYNGTKVPEFNNNSKLKLGSRFLPPAESSKEWDNQFLQGTYTEDKNRPKLGTQDRFIQDLEYSYSRKSSKGDVLGATFLSIPLTINRAKDTAIQTIIAPVNPNTYTSAGEIIKDLRSGGQRTRESLFQYGQEIKQSPYILTGDIAGNYLGFKFDSSVGSKIFGEVKQSVTGKVKVEVPASEYVGVVKTTKPGSIFETGTLEVTTPTKTVTRVTKTKVKSHLSGRSVLFERNSFKEMYGGATPKDYVFVQDTPEGILAQKRIPAYTRRYTVKPQPFDVTVQSPNIKITTPDGIVQAELPDNPLDVTVYPGSSKISYPSKRTMTFTEQTRRLNPEIGGVKTTFFGKETFFQQGDTISIKNDFVDVTYDYYPQTPIKTKNIIQNNEIIKIGGLGKIKEVFQEVTQPQSRLNILDPVSAVLQSIKPQKISKLISTKSKSPILKINYPDVKLFTPSLSLSNEVSSLTKPISSTSTATNNMFESKVKTTDLKLNLTDYKIGSDVRQIQQPSLDSLRESKQDSVLKLSTEEVTDQIQEPIFDTERITETRQASTPRLRIGRQIKTPPFMPLDLKNKETGFFSNEGFNTLAKEKGKWVKLNKKPLDKTSAWEFGADAVDNSSSASFKVVEAKEPAKDKYSSNNMFLRGKFRQKDRIFIEKDTNRIDTGGEIRGISAKGWASNRLKKFRGGFL